MKKNFFTPAANVIKRFLFNRYKIEIEAFTRDNLSILVIIPYIYCGENAAKLQLTLQQAAEKTVSAYKTDDITSFSAFNELEISQTVFRKIKKLVTASLPEDDIFLMERQKVRLILPVMAEADKAEQFSILPKYL